MTFMTYNVAGCVGRQDRFDARRILGIIENADADVVALQEVYEPKGGGEFLTELRKMGYATIHFGPAVRDDEGHYGNALMVRNGGCRIDELDLTVGEREPRSAIRGRFLDEGREIEVVATHFGLGPSERSEQISRLAKWIRDSDDPSGLRVVLGDLNEWWKYSRREKRITHDLGRGERVQTFPARFPVLCLDRILVDGGREDDFRWERFDSPVARGASDHLPLLMHWQGKESSGDRRRGL